MDKYYWLVLAVVMVVVEVLSPIFGFILVAAAAALAAAAAAIHFSLVIQILVFVFAVLFFIGLLRPRIIKKIYSAEQVLSRTEMLMGKIGKVVEEIDPVAGTGRVIVIGQDWAARSDQKIAVGAQIKVDGADGIVLKVSAV